MTTVLPGADNPGVHNTELITYTAALSFDVLHGWRIRRHIFNKTDTQLTSSDPPEAKTDMTIELPGVKNPYTLGSKFIILTFQLSWKSLAHRVKVWRNRDRIKTSKAQNEHALHKGHSVIYSLTLYIMVSIEEFLRLMAADSLAFVAVHICTQSSWDPVHWARE